MAMPILNPADEPFRVSLPAVGGGDEDDAGREFDNRVVTNIEFIVVATGVCDDSDDDCAEDKDFSELIVVEPLAVAVGPGSDDWLDSAA